MESLFQLKPMRVVAVACPSKHDVCHLCGAVKRLSFSPLLLATPPEPGWRAVSLEENPEIVIVSPEVRDRLIALTPDLQLSPAYVEATYAPSAEFEEGWSDL
jgi:hypothetical protein